MLLHPMRQSLLSRNSFSVLSIFLGLNFITLKTDLASAACLNFDLPQPPTLVRQPLYSFYVESGLSLAPYSTCPNHRPGSGISSSLVASLPLSSSHRFIGLCHFYCSDVPPWAWIPLLQELSFQTSILIASGHSLTVFISHSTYEGQRIWY